MGKQKNAISLAVQAGHLTKLFASSEVKFKNSWLMWVVRLQPSPLSDIYRIQIKYKIGKPPQVRMLDPQVATRDGLFPEHLYDQERLCLYLPRAFEWGGDMLLADTIVPWISEWLLHYEIWLATGEWCGGGLHPSGEKQDDINGVTIKDDIIFEIEVGPEKPLRSRRRAK